VVPSGFTASYSSMRGSFTFVGSGMRSSGRTAFTVPDFSASGPGVGAVTVEARSSGSVVSWGPSPGAVTLGFVTSESSVVVFWFAIRGLLVSGRW
jgi:hypothetical protein